MKTPKPEILEVVVPHSRRRKRKFLIQESCCGDKRVITGEGLYYRERRGDWRCPKCSRDKDEDLVLEVNRKREPYEISLPTWPVPPMVLKK